MQELASLHHPFLLGCEHGRLEARTGETTESLIQTCHKLLRRKRVRAGRCN